MDAYFAGFVGYQISYPQTNVWISMEKAHGLKPLQNAAYRVFEYTLQL